MRSLIALLMFACAIVAAAAVSPAAPAQDRVPYPGLMTQGKFWIQNTGRAEAVPVVIENMAKDWEAVGVQPGAQGSTVVLLKRPRGEP